MGYYARLYEVTVYTLGSGVAKIFTSVYESGDTPDKPYISWTPESSRHDMKRYADGTIYSSVVLRPVSGCNVLEDQIPSNNPGGILSIRAGFDPRESSDATVCHIILPREYVPRADLDPFVQPRNPYVKLKADRFVLTWAIRGKFKIEFCATPLSKGEDILYHDLSRVLQRVDMGIPEYGVEMDLHYMICKFCSRSA